MRAFANNETTNKVIYIESSRNKLASKRARTEAEVLKQAKKDVEGWFDYWCDNIQRGRNDIYCTFVSMWDANTSWDRQRKRKSVLEFNRLYTHVTQVLGEQRQNTPDFQVRALYKDAIQSAIDLRAGILRQTSCECRSDIAYQTCFRSQICAGFGALQVDVDYENDKSFELVPKIYTVQDPTLCFWDPMSRDHDKGDGRFCGFYTTFTLDDFTNRWGDKAVESQSFPQFNFYDYWAGWGSDQFITVADYYVKEFFNDTLCELTDGSKMWKKEADAAIEQNTLERNQLIQHIQENNLTYIGMPPALGIERKRDVRRYKIMHYKMTLNSILEKTEWPSDKLPIIYVDGDSQWFEGRQRTKSMIYFAKDAQRFYNYAASEAADALVHSHREQWMITPENIKTEEEQALWRQPDIHGVLIAHRDKTGALPEKLQPFTLSPTLFQMMASGDNDISQILGRYQSNLGAEDNATSGVAIQNRVKQGNASTFAYLDNLNRGIGSVARVILGMIPRIYDGTRDVITREADGEQKITTVNEVLPGNYIQNAVDDNEYTVEVIAGPNYEVQKAQNYQQLIQLAQLEPATAPLLMDLIAANIDVENMPQLVERLKTLVPPAVLAKEKGEQPPPPPPQQPDPNLLIEQMKQQNQMAEINLKRLELAQKEQQLQFDRQKAVMDFKLDAAKTGADIHKANLDYDQSMKKSLMDDAQHKRDALTKILTTPTQGMVNQPQ